MPTALSCTGIHVLLPGTSADASCRASSEAISQFLGPHLPVQAFREMECCPNTYSGLGPVTVPTMSLFPMLTCFVVVLLEAITIETIPTNQAP